METLHNVWVSLQGRAIMSPQCKPSDVLLHADVAIGTHRRLLSIAATALLSIFHEPSWLPGFLFPWPRCSLMQQNPEPPLAALARYQPRERYSTDYRLAHWLTDWLTDWLAFLASHSYSWANTLHDPNLLPQSLTDWLQFSTTLYTVS